MKVLVDRDLCEANAVCVKLAPEVFHLDDSETLRIQLSEVPPTMVEAVQRAVQSCPKTALRLDE